MWEAFEHASYYELDNLVAILDINRLGQTGETMHGWDLDVYARRAEAFGWHTLTIDGHDVEAVDRAINDAKSQTTKPTLIVAKTIIGKGSPNRAGTEKAHGEALGEKEVEATRAALGWPHEPFSVPDEAYAAWNAKKVGAEREAEFGAVRAEQQVTGVRCELAWRVELAVACA